MEKEENQVWCDLAGECVQEGVVVVKVMKDKDAGLFYGEQEGFSGGEATTFHG